MLFEIKWHFQHNNICYFFNERKGNYLKEFTKENIIDLLYGCTVLGTGGGGGLDEGLAMMEEDFQKGRTLKVVDVAEIPDDAYIATPYGCGAPIPAEGVELSAKYKRLPQIEGSPTILAFQKLEEFMRRKFFAVSSTELGGANTAEALHIACMLGIPIADADPAGRSVPELQHSTYYIKKVPIAPMGLATQFGDVAILSDVYDDLRAEDMVRAMAVVSNDLIGVVDHPTTGKIYRESVIVGALSYALRIGELLRNARERGECPAQLIASSEKGKVLFIGEVMAILWETTDGFNIGEIHIRGTHTYDGDTYRIWYKNENLISYKNEKIDVTCPDLICVFNEDGMPVTNPDAKVGMKVTVIALPAPEIWQTPEGLECFGPRSFGFDVDYEPFSI